MKKFFIIFAVILIFLIIKLTVLSLNSTTSSNIVKSGENFHFFIISDPHYLSSRSHDNGESFKNFVKSSDKMMQYSDEFLNVVEKDVIDADPEFIVLTGDLTCNGLKESHLDLSKKLHEIEKTGTNVFVIPGNHDIMSENCMYYFNDDSIPAESINEKKFIEIYSDFGYDEAISRDKNSLSYLAAPTEDIWLLMLDTTKDFPDQGGILKSSTLKWVEECSKLADSKNAKIIAVMHHSLLDHSKEINENYTLSNNEEVLNVFQKCNIEITLTGHIHLQDIKSYSKNNETFYDIATSSLSVYPHQYGEIDYSFNKGMNYKTIMLNMEQYAFDNNLSDESLIEFEKYSDDFFKQNCCKVQKNLIENLNELNCEEKDKVFDTVSKINKMYFAGYRNNKLSEIIKTEGFLLLKGISSCSIKDYVMSVLNDERTNNNFLYIPLNMKKDYYQTK